MIHPPTPWPAPPSNPPVVVTVVLTAAESRHGWEEGKPAVDHLMYYTNRPNDTPWTERHADDGRECCRCSRENERER